jgi:hypothetical protein
MKKKTRNEMFWWVLALVVGVIFCANEGYAGQPGSNQSPDAKSAEGAIGTTEGAMIRENGRGLALQKMLGGADLVFLGTVESLKYALSEPGEGEQTGIPHTFVTYAVEKVFKGSVSSTKVTLRFIGGLDPKTGRFLATSITPQFDMNDRDLLFVKGNTVQQCPLLGNTAGRLRIVGDQVYTDGGRAVHIDAVGNLRMGSLYRLEEVETTQIDGTEYKLAYDSNARKLPSDAESDAADVEELVRALQVRAPSAEFQGEFINADPSVPFKAPDMRPSAPPPM